MGYSEIVCQICGVSFNVARMRRKDEPANAAIGFVPAMWTKCPASAGCEFVKPSHFEDKDVPDWISAYLDSVFIDDVQARSLLEIVNPDPVQFKSDAAATLMELYKLASTGQALPEGSEVASDVDQSEGVETDENPSTDQMEVEIAAEGTIDDDNIEGLDESEDEDVHEHLAGPGCIHPGGYSGHDISVEEMKYSNTWQALCRKVDTDEFSYRPAGGPFTPAPDDEDFEIHSNVFLSGLSDIMAPRDGGPSLGMAPARHGVVNEPCPENHLWEWAEDVREYSLPFHPYCLEVYKRAAIARHGDFEIDRLVDWWTIEHTYEDFVGFPRNEDVQQCREQYWIHAKGTEYLVAQPLCSLELSDILQKCQTLPSSEVSDSSMAFSQTSDPFTKLSPEINCEIMTYLPSSSIAALQLASRAFAVLPQKIFHHLLTVEYPWLWEINRKTFGHSGLQLYSRWTLLTAEDLKAPNFVRDAIASFVDCLEDADLKAYLSTPAKKKALLKKIPVWLKMKKLERERDVGRRVPMVGKNGQAVDWQKLYTLLVHGLKGQRLMCLRNRARIWTDCQEILKRIDQYLASGTIPIKGDANTVIQARAEEDSQVTRGVHE